MKLWRHVWQSRPSWKEAFFSMLFWSVATVACVLADYFLLRHFLPPATLRIILIFAVGAALAAPLALWCARVFARKNQRSCFAAMFVFLSLSTVSFTAFLFSMDFYFYFAHWHGEPFSKLWLIQFAFTFASAIYQFLVSGLRLYLPFGLIAQVVASIWASRHITR
jgi:hypothetical protein